MAGHARLPASRWITSPSTWQIGAVATQVDLVAASPSLAATPQLGLSVVQVTPPAVPSPTGVATPGVSVLSPTKTVVLNVVLTNNGSVDEPHASVTFTLTPQPTGAATTARRGASVLATRSVSLAPVTLRGEARQQLPAHRGHRGPGRADRRRRHVVQRGAPDLPGHLIGEASGGVSPTPAGAVSTAAHLES